ncbi:MAG: Ig-like domain-containing protein [Saprospiraceae bacterium]|nr:Ig-like domain-containing protein [Saprospiraceae bacterium]
MTGCISNPTANLTCITKTSGFVTGNNNICVGQTTQLSPAGGGSWASMNPSVASVDNNGVVTGLSNGSVQFTFTTLRDVFPTYKAVASTENLSLLSPVRRRFVLELPHNCHPSVVEHGAFFLSTVALSTMQVL